MLALRSGCTRFGPRIAEDLSKSRSQVLLGIGPLISARALNYQAAPGALSAPNRLHKSLEASLPWGFCSRKGGRHWEIWGDFLTERSGCCKTSYTPASHKQSALQGLAIAIGIGATGLIFDKDVAADSYGLGGGAADDRERRMPGQLLHGDAGGPNYDKNSECCALSSGESIVGERGDLLAKVCIAISTLVFGLWNLALWLGQKSDVAVRLMLFLNHNFVLSYEALKRGRLFPIVTSMFSHVRANHFLVNMVVCWTFVHMVAESVGLRELLALYFGGQIFACAYGFLISRFYKKESVTHFVGASGGLCALTVFYLLARERAEPLFGLPLDYFETAIGLFIASDAAGSIAHLLRGPRRVGWLSVSPACDVHIGGMIFGALFYHLLHRRGAETSSELDSDLDSHVKDPTKVASQKRK